jgi:hypothetical protein
MKGGSLFNRMDNGPLSIKPGSDAPKNPPSEPPPTPATQEPAAAAPQQ